MTPDINIEQQLDNLADVHNLRVNELCGAWNSYINEKIQVRDRHEKNIRTALHAEAKSRTNLYNAVLKSPQPPQALWGKVKSRVKDLIKYGWRKNPGRIVCKDQIKACAVLWEELSDDEYEQAVRTKTTLNKQGIKDLPARILAKAGIELEADTDEPFVSDAGDAHKLLAALRKDGWKDE